MDIENKIASWGLLGTIFVFGSLLVWMGDKYLSRMVGNYGPVFREREEGLMTYERRSGMSTISSSGPEGVEKISVENEQDPMGKVKDQCVIKNGEERSIYSLGATRVENSRGWSVREPNPEMLDYCAAAFEARLEVLTKTF